jgi:hypothetical protein
MSSGQAVTDMIKPLFVTFTGVDDHTDVARLVSLSGRYPVEWGMLFGAAEGVGRFPSRRKVAEVLEAGLRCSAHLCDDYAMQVLSSGDTSLDLSRFARVQVNARDRDYERSQLSAFASRYDRPVIRQVRGPFRPTPGVLQLYDCSGGRGVVPDVWPKQPDDVAFVGYSGGLGPGIVSRVLPELEARNYWIDMETGVRVNEVFAPSLCEAVLEEVYGPDRSR